MNTPNVALFTASKYHPYAEFWRTSSAILHEGFFLDQKRSSAATQEAAAEFDIAIEHQALDRVLQVAGNSDAGIFVVTLALLGVLFKKYSGKNTLIVDSPLCRTASPEVPYADRVPLVVGFGGQDSLRTYLGRLQETVRKSYQYQHYPFGLLGDAPGDYRTNVLIAFDQIHQEAPARHYDFTVTIRRTAKAIVLTCRYNVALFDPAFAANIPGHFTALLPYLSDPDCLIGDVEILPAAEKHQLLVTFNATAAGAPREKSIVEWFEEQALAHGAKTALVYNQVALTYRQLNEYANRIAHRLRDEYGVGPGEPVGLLADRSEWMIAAMLGILKAGGVYVPINPAFPGERVQYILRDAGVQVLLTEPGIHPDLAYYGRKFEREASPEAAPGHRHNPAPAAGGSDLAYVMYTSGSTGVPNGVLVEHGSVCNLVQDTIGRIGITPDDRLLQFVSVSFDVSVLETLSALLSGATLVLAGNRHVNDAAALMEYILEKGASIVTLPASFFNVLDISRLTGLRAIITGGEAPSAAKAKLSSRHCAYFNMYGPTECTVTATAYRVTGAESNLIPIGRPIANTKIYLLDEQGQLVPAGVEGEICVAGAGVARGYLNRDELTRKKFVDNPYREPGYERIYKTGDLGRWTPDGQLVFTGRKDTQIKVRGYRMEPGEIATVIESHPAVQEACIYADAPDGGGGNLLAAVTLRSGTAFTPQRVLALQSGDPALFKQLYTLPNGLVLCQLDRNYTLALYKKLFEEPVDAARLIRLEAGNVVFDVGANIGLFSLYAGLSCPGVTVYALEPFGTIYPVLSTNASLYPVSIFTANVGLSDEEHPAVLEYGPYGAPVGTPARATCKMTRLSAFMARQDVRQIDLLKISLYNQACAVLRGIDAGDWPKIKQVLVEVHDTGAAAVAEEILRGQGFYTEHSWERTPLPTCIIAASRLGDRPAKSPALGKSLVLNAGNTWTSPEAVLKSVKELCLHSLPAHMVPSDCKILNRIPLNLNGKVDMAKLALAEGLSLAPPPAVQPGSIVEEKLAGFWKTVLETTEVGVSDNFFEAGGNSLKLITLIDHISRAYPSLLTVSDLFDHPTIATQAAVIEKHLGVRAPEAAVQVIAL